LTNRTTAVGEYSVLLLKYLVDSSLIGRLKTWTLTWPHTGCSMLVYCKFQSSMLKFYFFYFRRITKQWRHI